MPRLSIASGRESQKTSGRNTRYEDSEADYAGQDEQIAVDLEVASDGQAQKREDEEVFPWRRLSAGEEAK